VYRFENRDRIDTIDAKVMLKLNSLARAVHLLCSITAVQYELENFD